MSVPLVYLSSALFNDKRIALGYSVVVHTVDPLKLFVHTIPSVRVCERAAGNLSDYDHYDCSSLITVRQQFTSFDVESSFSCVTCVSLRVLRVWM